MGQLTSSLVVRLVDNVTRPARGVTNSLLGIQRATGKANGASFGQRLGGAIEKNNRALSNARGGLVDAVAGFYALKTAIGAPVRAAMEFESTMADVKKVVDGFDTKTESGAKAFGQFKEELRGLSREIPLTTNQLGQIAAAGGEAGFAAEELIQFTRDAATAAVAFGSSAAETGGLLAAMQKSYGMSRDEAMLLTDSMNHLSNNMATNAPKLMDFWKRIAADAAQAGFSQEEAMALGAAMTAAGADSSTAATSFRNMSKALTRGDSATKRQSDGLKLLGFTSSQVSKDMQDDAVGTTRSVLEAISKLPDFKRKAAMSNIFGDEARALGSLAVNLDVFDKAIASVSDSTKYSGSAMEEFKVKAGTFENATITMRNGITDLKVSIGDALIPSIKKLMESMSPIIVNMTKWIGENPKLVTAIIGATTAVIGFKVAMAGLKFVGLLGRGGALSLLSIGFNTLGRSIIGAGKAGKSAVGLQMALAGMQGKKVGGLAKVGIALRGMAMAVPGMGALASIGSAVAGVLAAIGTAIAGITAPVWGAIAAAVALVAAAGAALWKYWDRLSSIFRGVGSAIFDRLKPAFEAIRPVIDALAPVVRAAAIPFTYLKDKVSGVVEWIKGKWNGFKDWFSGFFSREILSEEEKAGVETSAKDMTNMIIDAFLFLPGKLREIGINIIQGLIGGIKSKVSDLKSSVTGVASKITGWFGKPLKIQSPSRVFMAMGGHIGEGLKIGINKTIPGVMSQTRKLADGVLSPMQGLSYAAPAMLGAAMLGDPQSGIVPQLSDISTPATNASQTELVKSSGSSGSKSVVVHLKAEFNLYGSNPQENMDIIERELDDRLKRALEGLHSDGGY